jgi:hypothetical protein
LPGGNTDIGRRPVAAFGNSDGDPQMLEWTQAGTGTRLMVLLHHDDATREWAYDSKFAVGTFSVALMDEARENGWFVISVKNDWRRISPFGLTVAKMTRTGRLPVKLQIGIEYAVVSQEDFGQRAQIKPNLIPVIPSLIESPILGAT